MDVRLGWFPELKIALTGATSFIGKSIAASIGRPPVPLADFSELPHDAILVHLAASISQGDVLATNFAIDRFVIEQAVKKLAGIVYASSNNVYDLGVNKTALELGPTTDEYGASKRVGESLVQALFPRSWAILRIADVFGHGQQHGNLFRAIEDSLQNRMPLKLYGVGGKVRSYIYAPELALVILHFVRALRIDILSRTVSNICYAESASVQKIVTTIAAKAGLPIEHVFVENDESSINVRTMLPGPFLNYRHEWTFDQALSHYINVCSTSRPSR